LKHVRAVRPLCHETVAIGGDGAASLLFATRSGDVLRLPIDRPEDEPEVSPRWPRLYTTFFYPFRDSAIHLLVCEKFFNFLQVLVLGIIG